MNLVVADEFYRRPSGRYRSHGTHTGEAFRDDLLIKKLRDLPKGEKLVVDFTGVTMAGSSFLEEAFGGIIRNHNFTLNELKDIFVIKFPRRPSLEEKVWEYIRDADRIKN